MRESDDALPVAAFASSRVSVVNEPEILSIGAGGRRRESWMRTPEGRGRLERQGLDGVAGAGSGAGVQWYRCGP